MGSPPRPTENAAATIGATSGRRPIAAYGISRSPARVWTTIVPSPYPASEVVTASVA